jgi:ureidoacrylate peracid hydrolase
MRVSIPSEPEALSLDLERTAVIVVDMQNDFGSKGGLFDRLGIDIAPIQAIVPAISRVLSSARRVGSTVLFLKMGFQADLSDAGPADGPNRIKHRQLIGEDITTPDGQKSRTLIRDTWSTDIIPALKPEASDMIVYKHRYSGFFETELDTMLRRHKIKHLVFTGCTTSVCVESTLRDAMFRDYSCVLLADCAAEPIGAGAPRSNHDATLLLIQTLFGWVSDSARFLKALENVTAMTPAI